MIFTLIAISALIIGIVCLIVDHYMYRPEWVVLIGAALIACGLVCSMIAGGAIISMNINKDVDYQNKLHEREMLEYRIDNMNDNVIGNEMLYNDIVEFNNNLRTIKSRYNNLWTNWFYNEYIAEIDCIELNSD